MVFDPEVIKKIEKVADATRSTLAQFTQSHQATIDEINKQSQVWAAKAAQIQQQMQPFLNQFKEIATQVSQNPHFQLWANCDKIGVNAHPVLVDIFQGQFDEEQLQKDWKKIRPYLWKRRNHALLGNDGEERYKQLLSAQTAKAYIAVCRATYAEIEALIRDELFKDDGFHEEYEAKLTASKRKHYTNKKVRDVTSERTTKDSFLLWGIDGSASINEVGIYTLHFTRQLKESFRSFDPEEAISVSADNKELNNNRHFHAHGWSKKATFLDGLNALLLFDLAMDVLNNKEKRGDLL